MVMMVDFLDGEVVSRQKKRPDTLAGIRPDSVCVPLAYARRSLSIGYSIGVAMAVIPCAC
jgi:hypothetical protein